MDDIAKSELVISKILTLLMEWGIQESELAFEELDLETEDYGVFFFPCIEWLVSEGIIRTGKIYKFKDGPGSGTVLRPVLTSLGFQILGESISIGNKDDQLANQIRKVSESGTNYSGVGDFFGGLLGGFTKSMSS